MNERLAKLRETVARYATRYAKYGRYAGVAGYSVFYVVCLFVFASLTAPCGTLKERIVASFNEAQAASGGQWALQIDDLGSYWLSGIKAKGVRLLSAPTEPGKPPGRIELQRATVRYSLLPLLVGNSDLNFDVEGFDGEISGSYDVSGRDTSFEAQFDSVDVGKFEPLAQWLDGVPIFGRLNGTVRLATPEGKVAKDTGSFSLEIKDMAVGDDKAKIKGAVTLPRINVGTLTFAAEAKEGVLKISKLSAGGKDLDLQGDGRITLRETADDSLCDAQLRFRLSDGYRGKNDVTKSVFGAPGSAAPALFELADPKIKQAKRADGFYSWALRGPLGHLDFAPKP
ncbi:MAG TPA: type II secretion system protein GspN [Polyangiaceae bacterium]|nr:type II secretion system protein GspN [Polyangiaceae bacterium]